MEAEASSSSASQFSSCSLSSSPNKDDTPTQSPEPAAPAPTLLPPAPGLYYSYPQKSAAWLALRMVVGNGRSESGITGSNVAAWVGLSPYKDTNPTAMWARATGLALPRVVGNEYTDYGERYEDRIRRIAQAAFGCPIKEYGLFRCDEYPFLAVSLDGETPALCLSGYTNALPSRSETFSIAAGRLIWEAKTSKDSLKPAPLVPYLCQVMLQMFVRKRKYALLHYFHADSTRIFLVRYSEPFMRWMLMRALMAHLHVERNVPIADDNRFFPWLIYPGGRHFPGSTVSDYLSVKWFNWMGVNGPVPPEPSLRRLAYDDWVREMELLGLRRRQSTQKDVAAATAISDGPWMASSSSSSSSDSELPPPCEHIRSWKDLAVESAASHRDPALAYLPPQPEVYLVYEFARRRDMSEIDGLNPAEVPPQTDPAWFSAHFPHVSEWANWVSEQDFDYNTLDSRDKLPLSLPHYDGRGPENTRMRYLFITDVRLDPSREEAEPRDSRLAGAELELFTRCLRDEEEKQRAKAQEEELRGKKRTLVAADADDSRASYAEQDRKRKALEDQRKKDRERQRQGLQSLHRWFVVLPEKKL